jgi:hypothetical protein
MYRSIVSIRLGVALVATLMATACSSGASTSAEHQDGSTLKSQKSVTPIGDIQQLLAKYATVRLDPDISGLSCRERQVVKLLIEAADIMNDLFWKQAYGDKHALLRGVTDPDLREYLEINFGPWDRLADNQPFIEGVGPKPAGANFYPANMTADEFEAAIQAAPEKDAAFRGLYTLIRRDWQGELFALPYHHAYWPWLAAASGKLTVAAAITEDQELETYLKARARALITDDYQPSDFAWMAMKNNLIDVVIGAVETYEDGLFGYKASYEGMVVLKDKVWSARLAQYATYLPQLQQDLPVEPAYKAEVPAADSELNAYDILYYAGDANGGAKSIAVNLPNDEEVLAQKGARRMQLKNAMQAKFEKILVPMTSILMASDQRSLVTFDAFFNNVMFHEVAHGLGIHTTLGGQTVRMALKEYASALEEGKADIVGLFLLADLADKGLIDPSLMNEKYVTFVASIFRSIRFGATSSHGRANVIAFNTFLEKGAITRDAASGTYRVDLDKVRQAVTDLVIQIVHIQGNGDYAGAAELVATHATIGAQLQADLDRVAQAQIPTDIVFEQGLEVLGLNHHRH